MTHRSFSGSDTLRSLTPSSPASPALAPSVAFIWLQLLGDHLATLPGQLLSQLLWALAQFG
jgi:hypothetical protein